MMLSFFSGFLLSMLAGRFVVGVEGTEGIVTFGTAGDQCGLTSKESESN